MDARCLGDLSVLSSRACDKLFRKVTLLMVVCAFLLGCSEADRNDEIVVSDSVTALNLTMPRSILSRRIEIEEYSLALSINGTDVSMVREGARWVGDAFVPHGTQLNVSLTWSARGVTLANLGRNYGPASATNTISISSSDYNYPDNDGDLLSNISELNAEPETNPFDANSPGIPNPVEPTDTRAISGVYDATKSNGDVSLVFISESGTYEILDYLGDPVDSPPGDFFNDCWVISSSPFSVQSFGDGSYGFEGSFAINEDAYDVFIGLDEFDNIALFLTSLTNSAQLQWDTVDSVYSDPGTFFSQEFYCVF